jgi:cytidine deaminase
VTGEFNPCGECNQVFGEFNHVIAEVYPCLEILMRVSECYQVFGEFIPRV